MTQVLVSVQNLDELHLALQAGIPWIDLKDPQAGSLGAPSLPILLQIGQFLRSHAINQVAINDHFAPDAPLLAKTADQVQESPHPPIFSLAAGECVDWSPQLFFPRDALQPFLYLKIALQGCRTNPDWLQSITQLRAILPPDMGLILVHYADAVRADAPSFDEVLAASLQIGSTYLLIDTWKKDGRGLRFWLDDSTLATHIQTCHQHTIRLSLAGGLTLQDLEDLLPLGPDVLAVRGAACNHEDRKSALCPLRLARLAELSHQHRSNPVCLPKNPNAVSKVAHEEFKI